MMFGMGWGKLGEKQPALGLSGIFKVRQCGYSLPMRFMPEGSLKTMPTEAEKQPAPYSFTAAALPPVLPASRFAY